jgi:Bifunctional DNA primase/polymerase, N-terminal
MLKAALAAQARGFHIFPVARNAKVPHPAAGQWGLTSTNDINTIAHFWTQVDPHANIGVACKPSQLLVVDCDIAKDDWNLQGTEWAWMHSAYGARVNGEDLLDEMAFKLGGDHASGLMTYSVRTRSGGLHLYYRWPAHWPHISQASPVKGVVDVRGNGGQFGGYVLGEGSQVDGGEYSATGEFNGFQINLPPEWIRLLVAEKPKQPKPVRLKGLMQPGAISWSGLVASVQNAGEGNRNNALVWAARTMCEEGATEAEAVSTLGPAASSAGLGDMEIERTIQSAYRTQRYKDGS